MVIISNCAENYFSMFQEVKTAARASCGQLMLTALKVASLFTVIIPFIFGILYFVSRKPIVKAVEFKIEQSTIDIIQRRARDIFGFDKPEDMKFFSATGGNVVFSMKKFPDLIFKTQSDSKAVEDRFDNIVQAREVCKTNRLGLLNIPEAAKFFITHDNKQHAFIAEKYVDISASDNNQEKLFATHAARLNETVRQATTFICKTKFSDVAWRNIPIDNDSIKRKGDLILDLIDLEERESVAVGLFGRKGELRRDGLAKCVTPEQIDIVIDEAKKHLTWTPELEEQANRCKEERVREWSFYKKQGLLEDKNKIIKISDDIVEELENISLKKLAKVLFSYVEKSLSEKNENEEMSVRERRRFTAAKEAWKHIVNAEGQSQFLVWLKTLRERDLICNFEETRDDVTIFV